MIDFAQQLELKPESREAVSALGGSEDSVKPLEHSRSDEIDWYELGLELSANK